MEKRVQYAGCGTECKVYHRCLSTKSCSVNCHIGFFYYFQSFNGHVYDQWRAQWTIKCLFNKHLILKLKLIFHVGFEVKFDTIINKIKLINFYYRVSIEEDSTWFFVIIIHNIPTLPQLLVTVYNTFIKQFYSYLACDHAYHKNIYYMQLLIFKQQ